MNARKHGFAKRASLSKWFASQEGHHGSVEDEPPRRATSVQKVPTVMLAGEPPHSFAKTASIRGSITSFAGCWGSCRATARTCSKRTARGDNRPEPPHQAVKEPKEFSASLAFRGESSVLSHTCSPNNLPQYAYPSVDIIGHGTTVGKAQVMFAIGRIHEEALACRQRYPL